MTLEQIRAEAMALPEEERLQLGEELRESDMSAEERAEVEKAWHAESAKRLEEIRAGKATLLPLEVVLQGLERRVGL